MLTIKLRVLNCNNRLKYLSIHNQNASCDRGFKCCNIVSTLSKYHNVTMSQKEIPHVWVDYLLALVSRYLSIIRTSL